MEESVKLLIDLVKIPGVSGHEKPIREALIERWTPLTDKVEVSKLGSVHGLSRATRDAQGESILIAAHMDQIGLMVTKVESGLLRVTEIGGIDQRTLPGLAVSVHTKTGDLPGIVVQPPDHTLPDEIAKKSVPIEHLWVDTGLTEKQVQQKVSSGDVISFSLPAREMGDGYISAPGLDNRASVAALTESLSILKTSDFNWDVWAAATVQEEETIWGAQTSGFDLRPTIAVVVDVNYGKGPGSTDEWTFEMGKGPTFDFGPTTHPKLYQAFEKIAKQHDIPYQRCVYPRTHGTDADMLQLIGEGIPTMCISIPLRYMHTPVEMVQIKDVQLVAQLLKVFIEQLDDDFMFSLRWDEEIEGNA